MTKFKTYCTKIFLLCDSIKRNGLRGDRYGVFTEADFSSACPKIAFDHYADNIGKVEDKDILKHYDGLLKKLDCLL
ncbi:hypothetical protein E4665_04685 [Sporolactobacillus shoreae]|uniref:Uncharacterized protein n=1 Tax=Sporolactobacillus shoreae TaxID=1465501 RepID=A0A4Z0GSL3_9BACL|nr:hypothetical protein [Sporolactobacillus shoreae]TGA99618.1 hypothetical protein E4665_04685 [Sporolactobacillus shoreae]